MLSQKQQRDIAAVGLLMLGLFLLAALIPVSMPGLRGVEFPEGNVMGPVGVAVRRVLTGAVGIAAFFLPGLLVLAGLRASESLSVRWTTRLSILLAGLLLIVPIGLGILGRDGATAGRWGELAGPSLVTAFGVPGAVLLVLFLLVTLSVGTIGWNPIASLVRGMAQGTGALARALFSTGERLKARWDQRSKDRMERTPPMELLKGDGASEREDDSEDVGDAVDDDAHGEPFEGDLEVVGRDLEGGDPFAEGEVSDTGLPPMEFMTAADDEHRDDMEQELDALGEVLIEKLRTFNVECTIGGRTTGPVVTQYEVIPAPGVKVSKIANLDADLALAMKAKSIRIVAPVPGRGAVGVEIPNPHPEVVRLRDILDSPTYQNSRAELPLALGKDLNGRPYVADLRDMPHILIAGATGSGKSVCLNTIITSLVYRHTPKTLRLLMVDPKMVELSTYRLLPHLRHKVVTDPRDAAGLLKWAVLEMDRRYNLLSTNGVRSIREFNERVEEGAPLRRFEPRGNDDDSGIYDEGVMPYIVVVVDELADLMMTVQSEVERPLTYLAQKARAIGIHLIVATQRPSVNVVTGLIKANFPARIAFRVASKTDSRTILDQNGADSLLGNGDMLFLPPTTSEPIRIQGAYISTAETDRMMAWYRDQIELRNRALDETEAAEESDILEQMRAYEHEAEMAVGAEGTGDWDDLFRAAGEVCVQHQQGSTSLLQRKLKVGYGRAARIVDQLHDAGILGPPEGSKAREVLVGLDDLETICGHRGL
jgi:S-DNA-T family DNA segregation ATPase FtsK/SpoIIIE